MTCPDLHASWIAVDRKSIRLAIVFRFVAGAASTMAPAFSEVRFLFKSDCHRSLLFVFGVSSWVRRRSTDPFLIFRLG